MRRKTRNRGRVQRSPAVANAVIAGSVGAAMSAGLFLLMRYLPPPASASSTLILVVLLPVLMIASAWLSAHYAMRVAIKPAIANARGHAGIVRLLGAGLDRLASGDTQVRITIVLPEPYKNLPLDFNMVAQKLQSARDDAISLRQQIEGHAATLDEASLRLGNRARKLSQRVEADLNLIAQLEENSPAEALRVAQTTLQGTAIAAQRNEEAAALFAGIGPLLRQETLTATAMIFTQAINVQDIAA